MKVPRRVVWVAFFAAAIVGCHHAAVPGGGPYPQDGEYDFRMIGLTPQVTGHFTIAEGQVYLDIPSAKCVTYASRKYHQPPGWRGFECRGLPIYPVVSVSINLRQPIQNSIWSATNLAEEPQVVGRECIQTGLNAQKQRICLAYRTITSTRNANKGGKLDVIKK